LVLKKAAKQHQKEPPSIKSQLSIETSSDCEAWKHVDDAAVS
jgi:hypothetical protein